MEISMALLIIYSICNYLVILVFSPRLKSFINYSFSAGGLVHVSKELGKRIRILYKMNVKPF